MSTSFLIDTRCKTQLSHARTSTLTIMHCMLGSFIKHIISTWNKVCVNIHWLCTCSAHWSARACEPKDTWCYIWERSARGPMSCGLRHDKGLIHVRDDAGTLLCYTMLPAQVASCVVHRVSHSFPSDHSYIVLLYWVTLGYCYTVFLTISKAL